MVSTDVTTALDTLNSDDEDDFGDDDAFMREFREKRLRGQNCCISVTKSLMLRYRIENFVYLAHIWSYTRR